MSGSVSFGALPRVYERVEQRQRRRRFVAIATAFSASAVTLAVLFLAFNSRQPNTLPASEPIAPMPSHPIRFKPSTYRQGPSVVMPVAFPDGTTAEIVYSPELQLAEMGVVPNTTGLLEGACGSGFIFAPYDLHGEVFIGDQPLATFDSPTETPVELWEGTEGFLPYYLVFRFGQWMAVVPCRQPLDQAQAAGERWAALLDGTEDETGFPVLRAAPPLVLSEAGTEPVGPELMFGGSGRLLVISPGTGCDSRDIFQEPGWARWCLGDESRSVVVTVRSDDELFIEDVRGGLEVRRIEPPATT